MGRGSSNGCAATWMYSTRLNCTLKMVQTVNFMLCAFLSQLKNVEKEVILIIFQETRVHLSLYRTFYCSKMCHLRSPDWCWLEWRKLSFAWGLQLQGAVPRSALLSRCTHRHTCMHARSHSHPQAVSHPQLWVQQQHFLPPRVCAGEKSSPSSFSPVLSRPFVLETLETGIDLARNILQEQRGGRMAKKRKDSEEIQTRWPASNLPQTSPGLGSQSPHFFSVESLSFKTGATSHAWLLSTWNVANLNWGEL